MNKVRTRVNRVSKIAILKGEGKILLNYSAYFCVKLIGRSLVPLNSVGLSHQTL